MIITSNNLSQVYTPITSNSNSTGNYNTYALNNKIEESNKRVIDYIEFILKIIGIDMSYDKFLNMSDNDKKQFLRDIKIDKII